MLTAPETVIWACVPFDLQMRRETTIAENQRSIDSDARCRGRHAQVFEGVPMANSCFVDSHSHFRPKHDAAGRPRPDDRKSLQSTEAARDAGTESCADGVYVAANATV